MNLYAARLLLFLSAALLWPQVARADGTDSDKNYLLPAFEIVGFEVLLNQYDRHFASDEEDYRSGSNSIAENWKRGWAFDRDSFTINQIGHPYQGSIYYGLARSAGLNFWESTGYAAVGSYLWEMAGETTRPSINDQITTTFGGSFLGEALYRTAKTFWKSADRGNPVSQAGAAIASPGTDFNKLALNKEAPPDQTGISPLMYRALSAGVLHYDTISNEAGAKHIDRTLGIADFAIDYGIPGKSGYGYEKPFDYFNLDLSLGTSRNDPVNHLLVNGLLVGTDYASGDSLRGIAGLYGDYNYIAPEIFRVASTALSAGTTIQSWLTEEIAFEGTFLAGCGFGAAGTIEQTDGDHTYHYGAVPQAQLNARIILKDRAMLDFSGQEFIVSGASQDSGSDGSENLNRLQTSLIIPIWGPHSVSFQYGAARRNASVPNGPDQHQRVESVMAVYSYVWGGQLGTADWRSTKN